MAVIAPMPAFPRLTGPRPGLPTGHDWLHEIKYDGYRMHARRRRSRGVGSFCAAGRQRMLKTGR